MDGIDDCLRRLHGFGYTPRGVLDVGAYEGWFAQKVRRVWPEPYILMIEAIEEKAGVLEQVVRQVGNADWRIALLGDVPAAESQFFLVEASTAEGSFHTGSSRYKENLDFPMEERRLPQQTLEALLERESRPFDFLKMDVQGSELDVLRGYGPKFADVEVVLMEISLLNYNQNAPVFAEVIEFMSRKGFVLFDVADMARHAGHLNQIDGVFVREHGALRYRF